MTAERIYHTAKLMSRYADQAARIICFPTSVTFVVVILLQVLFRYVLRSPIEWYIEVVEISYMWALFMGISIAYKAGSHIQFIFLFDRLDSKIQSKLSFICQLLALLFFLFMIIFGFKFFAFSKNYIMPTIEISQQWKFLCVPISGVILLLHTIELMLGNLIDNLQNKDTRRDFFRRA